MDDSNHDLAYIRHCRMLIEKKLHWRRAAEWRNYEFTALSEKIFDANRHKPEPNNIKKDLGKLKYESLPSTVTLNALASYLGYASWMDYKSKITLRQEGGLGNVILKKRVDLKTWIAGTLAVTICGISGLFFLSGKSSPKIENAAGILFTSRPIANGLPNSVVFNVDLAGNHPANVVIQQSWDSTKTVRLNPGQKEATGIYYYPGYFRAKLILDGKVVKEHDLFIKSDTWMATIDHDPIPSHLKKNELILDKGMTVTHSVLSSIRSTPEPAYLTYHLVKPFRDLPGDNFTLETSIKNIYADGSAVCKTAKIFVLCTRGAFIIPFTIPGCISDINLMANDLYLPGKENDLSSFSADLADWSAVKVETRDRHLKVFLNNKLIREEVYNENAGEVVGLRLSFLGAGSVNYVKLANAKGEIDYEEDFTTIKP